MSEEIITAIECHMWMSGESLCEKEKKESL